MRLARALSSCPQALQPKQLAAMAGAADASNPALLTVASYALKNCVHGNRGETEVMLDWSEVSKHVNGDGRVDGVVTDVGQTKVDRLQIGERKPLQCRSDCTGEIALSADGTIDGDKACPAHVLLEAKRQWERKLGLKPPMQLEEAVFADYALWADAPRGATVVALDEKSPLMTTAWKPKHAIMVVTKAQEEKGLRYRRGMALNELAADGETLLDVTPNTKGLWFEVAGKPYLVRPWTGASEISQRLRMLAIVAQKQAKKAGCDAPFGNAFKVSELKGVISSKSPRRTMATGLVKGDAPTAITMKQGGWAKEKTMLKYVEDTDPFAAGGINITDVIVCEKSASMATETKTMVKTLEYHVALLAEKDAEICALRQLLIDAGQGAALSKMHKQLIATTVNYSGRVQSSSEEEALPIAHAPGNYLADERGIGLSADGEAVANVTAVKAAAESEAAVAKRSKQALSDMQPCGCKRSEKAAPDAAELEKAVGRAPEGLTAKAMQEWLCGAAGVHVRRDAAKVGARKRKRVSTRKQMVDAALEANLDGLDELLGGDALLGGIGASGGEEAVDGYLALGEYEVDGGVTLVGGGVANTYGGEDNEAIRFFPPVEETPSQQEAAARAADVAALEARSEAAVAAMAKAKEEMEAVAALRAAVAVQKAGKSVNGRSAGGSIATPVGSRAAGKQRERGSPQADAQVVPISDVTKTEKAVPEWVAMFEKIDEEDSDVEGGGGTSGGRQKRRAREAPSATSIVIPVDGVSGFPGSSKARRSGPTASHTIVSLDSDDDEAEAAAAATTPSATPAAVTTAAQAAALAAVAKAAEEDTSKQAAVAAATETADKEAADKEAAAQRDKEVRSMFADLPPVRRTLATRMYEPLDTEQRKAVHAMLVTQKWLTVISGPAGAGKSALMKIMLLVWPEEVALATPTNGAKRSNQKLVDEILPRKSFKPELEVLTTYNCWGVGFGDKWDAAQIVKRIQDGDPTKVKAMESYKKKVVMLDEGAQTFFNQLDVGDEASQLLNHGRAQRYVLFLDVLQTACVKDEEARAKFPTQEMIFEGNLYRVAKADGELIEVGLERVYHTSNPDLLELGKALRAEDFEKAAPLVEKYATSGDDADQDYQDIVHDNSEIYAVARKKLHSKPDLKVVEARCEQGGPDGPMASWPAEALRSVREKSKLLLELRVFRGQRLLYEPIGRAGAKTTGGWYLTKGELMEVVRYDDATRQLLVTCPNLRGKPHAWIAEEFVWVEIDGHRTAKLWGTPGRYEDIVTVYSGQGSRYDKVHVRTRRFKGQRNLLYTACTRAITELKISGIAEDDGGDDLRTKMELHPKSVIWQAELLGDKSNFSAERLRAAHLEVQKQLTRASKRAGE